MGCVNVYETLHMVQLRYLQSHLCVWCHTWNGFYTNSVRLWCVIPICIYTDRSCTVWTISQNRLWKTQSYSERISPCEHALNLHNLHVTSSCGWAEGMKRKKVSLYTRTELSLSIQIHSNLPGQNWNPHFYTLTIGICYFPVRFTMTFILRRRFSQFGLFQWYKEFHK